MGFSFCRLGPAPVVGLGSAGEGGGGRGGVKMYFPKMLMWHIKLKAIMSRTGYK